MGEDRVLDGQAQLNIHEALLLLDLKIELSWSKRVVLKGDVYIIYLIILESSILI